MRPTRLAVAIALIAGTVQDGQAVTIALKNNELVVE